MKITVICDRNSAVTTYYNGIPMRRYQSQMALEQYLMTAIRSIISGDPHCFDNRWQPEILWFLEHQP